MVAQSSASDNDNLEIGTEGSEIVFIWIQALSTRHDHTTWRNITNNNWHHLVVTYGSDLKVYSMEPKFDNLRTTDHLICSGFTLSLGMARIFSDQWGDFNGSIDDFRIYRKELNASEISHHGNGDGDFNAMDQQIHNDSYVSEWMDSSGNQRHAFSDFVEAPVFL